MKKALTTLLAVSTVVALAGCADTSGDNQDAAELNLKVLATARSQHTFETWQWLTDEINKRGDGSLTATVAELGEVGLNGTTNMSIVAEGLFDIVDIVPGYVAGDAPLIEGVQLPGLFNDFDTSKKAWKDWGDALQADGSVFEGHILGTYGWECIYLYSAKEINSLDDIRGMKVRAFGAAQSDFLRELGGEPVSMGLGDVYSGMQRGVIDGVITGSTAGYGLSLHEVSDYVVDLNLGCTGAFGVISNQVWDSLSDDQQEMFTQLGEDFYNEGWDISQTATEGGIGKLSGEGVEFIPTKPEWADRLEQISRDVIVPGWVGRSGDKGKTLFNQVLAPLAGWSIN